MMDSRVPAREDAWKLLTKYTKTESLLKHALAVEGVMRYIARKQGEDEEKWGIIGLIHDLDWEQFPQIHCRKTNEILTEAGWPGEYIHAVMSHAWELCTDVKPLEYMEKALYTIDELTGLVNTTALVRPSKSVLDMKVSSVRKKWKDKRFAAGVNRSVIEKGAEMLGMELSEVIEITIMGMREVAEAIGLKGSVE
jgi:predicted hydrolase (HD superfamily)